MNNGYRYFIRINQGFKTKIIASQNIRFVNGSNDLVDIFR